MRFSRPFLAAFLLSLLWPGTSGPVAAADKTAPPLRVRESMSAIWVETHAPYPPEIDNETQARALAREAAVVLGQNAILTHVLAKKTRRGKTLAEAQVPSTEIQESVAALIRGAAVTRTTFQKDGCRLRVSVLKKNLKVILRKA